MVGCSLLARLHFVLLVSDDNGREDYNGRNSLNLTQCLCVRSWCQLSPSTSVEVVLGDPARLK